MGGAAIATLAMLTVVPTIWEAGGFRALPAGVIADRVLVEKSRRTLSLFRDGSLLKEYVVALGPHAQGPKQFEGDGRTPEGTYVIDSRKSDSAFHRALHISYPNTSDSAFAEAHQRSVGGAIMVHGIRNGLGFLGRLHRAYDWTNGCIAVTNREMDELWRAVPDGTPIELRP